jgi:heptose I phosphotransferase
MLIIPEGWQERWQGKDIFEILFGLEGEIYKQKEGRKTIRFSLDNKYYFAKLHYGIGWKEIIKNLFQLRLPVLGAQNEWRAIQRLHQLRIKAPSLVAYGKRGLNPARLKSFVVTEDVGNSLSLEKFCLPWVASPPDNGLKRALIKAVANIARVLHESGMNHRDFYICHFLLGLSGDAEKIDRKNLNVYLIDLHRAQMRRRTPLRWRVKDIAALYFSSMDIGLTQRDLFRFIRVYRNRPLRETLEADKVFWRRVEKRARAFYREFSEKTGNPLGEDYHREISSYE